ncbi:Transmembrane protein 161B [Cryptotermes secundus]|uniref:Transmembrane protein 161B n=1 Tax=Cryptotermes secundus TaxID=105785 RepID=A0A2J7RAJ8_9NEOP|nr:Transmembrane protein 161B [Cryptotermes secundus]
MALLGTQLVITLVMVSIIQKLGPHYSLARWILCSTGLVRYLYPTDEELRTLAGVPKDKSKGKKGGRNVENGKIADTFHIPRNLDIELETAKVTALDVVHLKFYSEYQWLLDFAVYSSVVYILTEVYHALVPPKDEVNLSMLWCVLVVGFAVKLLLSLTYQYFKSQESVGERSTVIVAVFAYLLVAMLVLIVDENTLELGLNMAYTSFNQSAAAFLEAQGLDSSGPASKLVLKFFLALWSALLGALFTFPGLRMAKMHWDTLRYYSENRLQRFLLNASFASPFLLVLLWVKPVSRDYLTGRIFHGMAAPLMTEHTFETMRLILIVVAVLLRLALMPTYLQAYLNMAHHRIEEQKKEIAAVFYYLCVVALQYVAPLILCLYLTFMYKSLGNYSWAGLFLNPTAEECSASAAHFVPLPSLSGEESIRESAHQFTLALDSLKQVFTADVFRGLFGFATWWCCFAWFSTSSLGMVYQSYFSHS